jgi:hypothetical protein
MQRENSQNSRFKLKVSNETQIHESKRLQPFHPIHVGFLPKPFLY